MALTEEQKRANQRRMAKYGRPGVSEKVADESAGWLSAQGADFPASEEGEYADLLRMMGNVPSNLRDEARGISSIVTESGDPETNIAHVMLRAIAGSGEEASRRALGTEDTENAQLFRMSADTIIDRITNPRRTIVEEPVSAFLDIASLGTRGALRETARAPGRIAAGATTKPYRGITRPASEIAAKLTTGHDMGEFKAIRKGSQISKESRKEILPYLREQKQAGDFAEVLTNAGERILEKRNETYRKKLPHLKIKDQYKDATSPQKVDQKEVDKQNRPTGRTRRVDRETPDPLGLRSVIKADLVNMLASDEYKIDVRQLAKYIDSDFKDNKARDVAFRDSKVGTEVNQDRIARFFKDVFYFRDDTIDGIDTLKQRIYGFKKQGADSPDFNMSNAIVERTYGNVRRVLGERVEGYDDLVRGYEEASRFKENIEKALNIKTGPGQPSIDEAVINKILPMLRDPANYDIRKSMVADLERAIDKPLAGMAAGLSLRKKVPKNLMPRYTLYALLSNPWGDIGAGNVAGILSDLALIPFTSPRVVGELFSALGANERTVKNLVEITRDTRNMLPEGVTEDALRGLSLGRAIQRYVVPQMEQLEVRDRLSGKARTGAPTAIHPPKMPAPLEEEELEQYSPTAKQAAY
jgi:hypothetical protein